MAVKDKLVTLEDLKTAYDKLKEMMDMYEDITSSLTWSNATWVPGLGTGNGGQKNTNSEAIAGVKVAKVSVSKGDKYRIYGWFDNTYSTSGGHFKTFPLALADSSDNVISVYAEYPEHSYTASTERRVSDVHYGETRATAPAKASFLYIFDFAGHSAIGATAGDIIVEKGI